MDGFSLESITPLSRILGGAVVILAALALRFWLSLRRRDEKRRIGPLLRRWCKDKELKMVFWRELAHLWQEGGLDSRIDHVALNTYRNVFVQAGDSPESHEEDGYKERGRSGEGGEQIDI